MRLATEVVTPAELQTNPFFDGLTDEEIVELLKVCTVHDIEPGDYVIKENELSRDIFIILGGRISIGKTLYAGDERELCVLGPGEFIGEMSFLSECPRSASASCIEDASLLRIDRDSFDELALRMPGIAYKITEKIACVLGERLRASNDMIESIFSNPNRTIFELKTRLLKSQTMLMRR